MMIELRFAIDRGAFRLDVDLALDARGVTAVFGPSGCGKTTLLRAIAGLERAHGGYLRAGDEVWQDGARFVAPHRRRIGYVFQEPSLFPHLSVRHNIEYGRKRAGAATDAASLDRAVALLGIEGLLGRSPHELSGGEQQRVAIARALAAAPALLLLDEPMSSLDEDRKREILPYLESLHRELDIPVVYVSHARDEVARLADRVVLLDAGRVVAVGPVGEVFSRLDLPIAHGADAVSVIDAVVAGHDDAFALSHLDFDGGRFTVPGSRVPVGGAVRVQVGARDVSLTLERQSGTSILNIFHATVRDIVEEGAAQCTVRLTVGATPLLARITRKSAADLGIHAGQRVCAQVKSVSLLG